MKRELWKAQFSEHTCPRWPCPTCRVGVFWLVQNSVTKHETADSVAAHNDEFGWPDLVYTFTAWAECQNPDCKGRIAICGSGGLDQQYVAEDDVELRPYFKPLCCFPMPPIIEIPPE
jgi:hypothetical protein